MATSFGALCNDFYVNQKLSLKMDLPADRETLLHLFDQVRKAFPSMDRFRRWEDEFALESPRRESEYLWLALRRTSLRTGHVNPDTMEEAYKLHRLILQTAPFHLTVSPLDIDGLELMFGFDLECRDNHDEVVYEALMDKTPMRELLRDPGEGKILDVQPIFGMSLNRSGNLQAFFEVRTRRKSRRGKTAKYRHEPISVILTLRQFGPFHDVKDLPALFDNMTAHAEQLAADRLVPNLLTPIARHITSSP